MKELLCAALLLGSLGAEAQTFPPAALIVPPAILIHDPVLTRQDGTYYLFGTGMGITVWSTKDRQTWTAEKPVFATPAWAMKAAPGFKGPIWAPDISFANGQYSLFYFITFLCRLTTAAVGRRAPVR